MQASGELIAVFAATAAAAVLAAAANLVTRLAAALRRKTRTEELVEVLWSLVPLMAVAWVAFAVLVPGHD